MNAFQEGTKIHFDTPEAKNNMCPFFPDVHGAPFNGREAMSHLTRWTVDMASNGEDFDSIMQLTETAAGFPSIDERFMGLPCRYGWIVQVCNRLDENRSDLLLLEVLDIEKGPVATIRIPIRLRFGLHGNWASADDVGLAA